MTEDEYKQISNRKNEIWQEVKQARSDYKAGLINKTAYDKVYNYAMKIEALYEDAVLSISQERVRVTK